MNLGSTTFCRIIFLLAVTLVFEAHDLAAQTDSASDVTLLHVPGGGIQPQSVMDSKGIIHLIYYKGEPKAGDIYYIKLNGECQPLGQPIRVNSQPGSAIAIGWVRGAQIAVGKNDQIHVMWNGSGAAQPRMVSESNSSPVLYTHLNNEGTAFEPQRNLITWASGIDGGGSLAADFRGNVYVFWHATAGALDEDGSSVFMTRSIDGGVTFSREIKITPPPPAYIARAVNAAAAAGACGCCSMRAFIDEKGSIYLLYRAAGGNINRDTILLVSRNQGESFENRTLAKWKLDACPLTVYSIAPNAASGLILGAWKNQDQVYFGVLNAENQASPRAFAPSGSGNNRKYPVIAANLKGEILLAWTENISWGKGGSLAWQIFDKNGEPVGEKGYVDKVIPAWSLLTAVTRSDGSFVIIF